MTEVTQNQNKTPIIQLDNFTLKDKEMALLFFKHTFTQKKSFILSLLQPMGRIQSWVKRTEWEFIAEIVHI